MVLLFSLLGSSQNVLLIPLENNGWDILQNVSFSEGFGTT